MNRKLYTLIGIAITSLGIGFSSCSDYLNVEKNFNDMQSEQKIFTDRNYTMQWLSYCYSRLLGDNVEVGHSKFCPQNFADDQVFTETYDRYKAYKLGEIGYGYDNGYDGYYQNSWKWSYAAIYQATVLINKVDQNTAFTEEEVLDIKGQARFLRAYFYWLLLKRYGPIPLMPASGVDYTKSYDELSIPRNTYEECVDFIAEEMKQAAKELPERRDNLNIARPTRGAALAVRAKAYLYGASPLANGNTEMADFVDKTGRKLIPQKYSEEKWAKAAAACRDVIDLDVYELNIVNKSTSDNGPSERPTVTPPADGEFSNQPWPKGWTNIDPLRSYRTIFDGTILPANNKELIFTRGATNIDMLVLHQMPKDDGGWNCHGMTQKMLDAYYMNNGSNEPGMNSMYQGVANYQGIVDTRERRTGFTDLQDLKDNKYPELGWKYDPKKGDNDQAKTGMNVSLQYVEREPRFYASVAYNGCTWYYLSQTESKPADVNQQVWYYFGSSDGYRNDGFYLRTGIGIKKFVHPNDYPGNYVAKAETAIRYADILLLYAEALNELTGTYNIPSWNEATTYTISRDKEQMERGIHPVRIRAGLPDYPDEFYLQSGVDDMRKALKRERMIELMGEGKRYFDIRRWKDAPVEESLQIYGCNVFVGEAKRDEFHSAIPVYNLPSTFSEKLWLWPIKHSELKRNSRLTQNPGWTMYD